MDFSAIIDSVVSFSKANMFIAGAGGVLLVFLLYRKPKLFFTIFFISLLLAGIFYLISNVSSIGGSHKGKMIDKKMYPVEQTSYKF